jgi:cation transport ATPase
VGARDLGTVHLQVDGMSCSFCSESIRKAVGRLGGVEEVRFSLAHEEALVRFSPARIRVGDIEATLRDLGYVVRDPQKVRRFDEQREALAAERRRQVAAAIGAGLFVLAMSTMWAGLWTVRPWHTWVALSVATLVLFRTGGHILSMAWGAARRGIANQHVLLAVGALGGYLVGLLGTPVPTPGWRGLVGFPPIDFYGVVVFLTTYHLLSGYVSLQVRTRASRSVQKLLDLTPPRARVVRGGMEEEVAIEDVRLGDRVRVRPGERMPVDGEVVEGRSAVNEALVTGEPIPAAKAPGQEVIGGSVTGPERSW